MVVTRPINVRWIRKYKIFFIIGIFTIIFQIYLATQFIFLNNDSKITIKKNYQKEARDMEEGANSARKFKDGLVDDEDSLHSVSLQSQRLHTRTNTSNKVNNKNTTRLRLEDLDFTPICSINIKESISAIHRAKTQRCKQIISNVTCLSKQGSLYPPWLPHYCPTNGLVKKKALGCFKDNKKIRLLDSYFVKFENTNSPDQCIEICLQSGFPYAGLQYSTECFCGNEEPPPTSRLPDSSCNMKCPSDSHKVCGGYFTMNIYETGIARTVSQTVATVVPADIKKVKIVFLLTLNGRALRQVLRLIKILFHKNVYFYIHVDIRQDYLFRELLPLEKKFPNIKLTRNRFSTIWGGASLLQMLLLCMKELLKMEWKWDFVINLSESDYPVKVVEQLIEFLSANSDKNFVKSHGREAQRFIQKQGLDKTFVECDHHMWRVADRKLPEGIVIDGGSDWVALSREFIEYVTSDTPDELVSGLLKVFRYTLLPAESFFHTVLKNSKFCDKYVDNNLHVTNWKRKLGCKCQYKHIVDWCGCSPNDFKPEDWIRIQNTETKQIYFARKFEPVVNQAVILQLEQWLFKIYNDNIPNINSYWQNVYHYQDLSPPNDALLTVAYSIARIVSNKLFSNKCNIFPIKVLEVTSFHVNDMYQGSLILLETNSSSVGNIRLEAFFQPKNLVSVQKLTTISKRFENLAVSTDFDPKEKIFRNFERAMGPHSEPSLMYQLISDIDLNVKASNFSVLWINPIGNLVDVSTILIDETFSIENVKPTLNQPLLPGIWTVKIIHKQDVLIQVKFLITPLEFLSGNEISNNQVNSVQLERSAIRDYDPLWEQYIPRVAERESLRRTLAANSKRYGNELRKWIDSLVSKVYIIHELCIVNRTNNSCFEGLPLCKETNWSSLAPDPKSVIGKYNARTQRFPTFLGDGSGFSNHHKICGINFLSEARYSLSKNCCCSVVEKYG